MSFDRILPGLKSSKPPTDDAGPLNSKNYITEVNAKWRQMIEEAGTKRDSKEKIAEEEFHAYLEQNPSILSAVTTVAGAGHHGTVLNIVFSKPMLSSHKSYEPDFMIISKTSEEIIPLLVEIESPTKKCLKSDGTPTAEFTQAKSQLSSWKQWLDNEINMLQFRRTFLDPLGLPMLPIRPKFILVMGTRSEKENEKHRGNLTLDNNTSYYMSYNRLGATEVENSMSVRLPAGETRPRVHHLSPDFAFGPNMGKTASRFSDWESAIERMQAWPDERKTWAKQRVEHWISEWSKEGIPGISDSDTE